MRVKIDPTETETLIRCGAFDELGPSRPELLWQLELLCKRGDTSPGLDSRHYSMVLPFCANPSDPAFESIPKLPQYKLREKLWSELECLDLTVSSHLLLLYDMDRKGQISAREISKFAGRIVTLAGWLINSKRTRTVKNEFMKFLMLEDTTETFEVTLFPKIYKRFGPLLYDRGPYLVKGRVEREGRCCTVTALWVGRIQNQRKTSIS